MVPDKPELGKGSRQRLGKWGEGVAAVKLRASGYQIITQNWRCRAGEIDIVAQKGDLLIFVEVKTRRGRDLGMPEEGLTRKKVQKLITLAQQYLLENELDVDWRIDLVAVELDKSGKLVRCEHIPNAVLGW